MLLGYGRGRLSVNSLVIIGWMGDFTAYLNTSREKAIAEWSRENASYGLSVDELSVRTIEFEDRFKVYDAWAV